MPLFHGFFEFLAVFDDAGLYHLPEEVVTLPGTFTDPGKDGESVVFLCNIVDKFLDKNGLADSRSSEKSDFPAFQIRFKKIYDLYPGIKHFLRRFEVLELRGFSVNRERVSHGEFSHTVYGLSDDIHDPPSNLRTYRHFDRFTGTGDLKSSAQAIRGIHGNTADSILSYMLLDLDYELPSIRTLDLESIVN